jgi:hypothetical protein
MRKYIIIGSVAVFILVAVSVFALQGKTTQTAASNEVAPLAASTSSSGCGASGSGCGSSAGCGGPSGGCGGEALNPTEAKVRTDQITDYLVDYYTNKRGLSDVAVKVESFGCHEEATVTQAGQVVEKLSINGSRITKLES